VPPKIAPAVTCTAHRFVEVDGNQHCLFEASYDEDVDAVAGIATRAQKSVQCYEFCYGEERKAET